MLLLAFPTPVVLACVTLSAAPTAWFFSSSSLLVMTLCTAGLQVA
jgi:hypothetical protein